MKIERFTGGFVQTNGYLVEGPGGHLLIDAPAGVASWLKAKGVTPAALLLTHQHYDHVEDAAALQAAGVPVFAFADYSTELTLEAHARSWGLPIGVTPYQVDHLLSPADGRTLDLAGFRIGLAHVPGHSTDSVTFHFPEQGVLFSGDTLFAGGIGRYDLPNGNGKQLLDGIRGKLLALPGETRVFPGHGPDTNIAEERAGNPYL